VPGRPITANVNPPSTPAEATIAHTFKELPTQALSVELGTISAPPVNRFRRPRRKVSFPLRLNRGAPPRPPPLNRLASRSNGDPQKPERHRRMPRLAQFKTCYRSIRVFSSERFAGC
jgi:hypothetical protein